METDTAENLSNQNLGTRTGAQLPILPLIDVCPQTLNATQGIGNRLPLFGRSAVIHRKHVLPFAYLRLGCPKPLLHLGPVCFEDGGPVRFVPRVIHLRRPWSAVIVPFR
jgi:hypothetical protein